MGAQRYVTRMSIPLLRLPGAAVLREVRAALASDRRVEGIEPEPAAVPPGWPAEHLHVSVRLRAESASDAERTAADVHGAVLRRVLGSIPADSPAGWTSAYGPPEPAGDDDGAPTRIGDHGSR